MNNKLLPKLIDLCIENQPKKYSNFTLCHVFVEADGGSGYLWQADFGDSESYIGSGETPEEATLNLLTDLVKNK